MRDMDYDNAVDDFDDYQIQAQQVLIDTTRKNVEDNLKKAKLNKHDIFIVSSSVIFSLVTANSKALERTTPTVDEVRLMEAILKEAHARRYGSQASAKNHSTLVKKNVVMTTGTGASD